MSLTLIINPYANRWKCGRKINAIKKHLDERYIEYKLYETEYKGHAIQLAHKAILSGQTNIIAVGGDGTVNEVINGILSDKPYHKVLKSCRVGIIPLGTANDLAYQLRIPSDINKAIQIITDKHTRKIDIGVVNERYFINNSAVGLETEVTLTNEQINIVKGTIRYLLAAVLTIIKRPTWQTTITWNDHQYTGSLTLVSVGNSNRTGGIFYMTPNAILDDGMLDFIYAAKLNRFSMFSWFYENSFKKFY